MLARTELRSTKWRRRNVINVGFLREAMWNIEYSCCSNNNTKIRAENWSDNDITATEATPGSFHQRQEHSVCLQAAFTYRTEPWHVLRLVWFFTPARARTSWTIPNRALVEKLIRLRIDSLQEVNRTVCRVFWFVDIMLRSWPSGNWDVFWRFRLPGMKALFERFSNSHFLLGMFFNVSFSLWLNKRTKTDVKNVSVVLWALDNQGKNGL